MKMNTKQFKCLNLFIDGVLDCRTKDGSLVGQKFLYLPYAQIENFDKLSRMGIIDKDLFKKTICQENGKRVVLETNFSVLSWIQWIQSWILLLRDFVSVEKLLTFIPGLFTGMKHVRETAPEMIVKIQKFQTIFLPAKFLRQSDIPNSPVKWFRPFFSGAIRRFLKSRLLTPSRKNYYLFNSIAQGLKRNAMRVPESFVKKTLEEHRELMASEKKTNWYFRTQIDGYFDRFVKDFTLRSSDIRGFQPSRSASTENKRDNLGQLGELTNHITFTPDEFYGFVETRPGKVEEVRGYSIDDFFRDSIPKEVSSLRKVRVAPVLEPNKVRVVSCGESKPYYWSHFFQKKMWKYLQRFPQFALTGTPVCNEILEKTLDLNKSNSLFVSGDYSQATNMLHMDMTKDAFNAFLDKSDILTHEECNILRSVLFEQELSYPPKFGIPAVRQVRGQLMGSILSFPILCMINLCCFWLCYEKFYNKTVDLKSLPVLVNGDDILFKEPIEFINLWKETVAEVGFQLSPGKNYVHRKMLQINSTTYTYSKESGLVKVPFLNIGFITGQAKLTGRDWAKDAPVSDYFNNLTSSCEKPEVILNQFLHYNKRKIKRMTRDGLLNLFIDQAHGGLGFKPTFFKGDGVSPLLSKIKITPLQKGLALLCDYQLKDQAEKGCLTSEVKYPGFKLIDKSNQDKPKTLSVDSYVYPVFMNDRFGIIIPNNMKVYEPKNVGVKLLNNPRVYERSAMTTKNLPNIRSSVRKMGLELSKVDISKFLGSGTWILLKPNLYSNVWALNNEW